MAILASRFARAGAVAFVIMWAAATLAVTAASLDSGPRGTETRNDESVAEEETSEAADEAVDNEAVDESPVTSPTIKPPETTVAPAAPSATATTSTAPTAPEYLTIPPPTSEVPTLVLPAVAAAPEPVQADPDFAG